MIATSELFRKYGVPTENGSPYLTTIIALSHDTSLGQERKNKHH